MEADPAPSPSSMHIRTIHGQTEEVQESLQLKSELLQLQKPLKTSNTKIHSWTSFHALKFQHKKIDSFSNSKQYNISCISVISCHEKQSEGNG